MALKLMYITNRLPIALIAEKYGVDRIWIDLETVGKEERQKGRDSVKSQHTIDDIKRIKPYLTSSELLVRVNPWHENSVEEINEVIDSGTDIIMLPYWKSSKEVVRFLDVVSGRCKTVLLLETREAVDCLDEVLLLNGIDEIHIGLNDLHLSYNLSFMFELLINGVVRKIVDKIGPTGIPYGFGGIAKIGHGDVPAEMIIMEHYNLGSTRAILSRQFCDCSKIDSMEEIDHVFRDNMRELREYEKYAANATVKDYEENRIMLKKAVDRVVRSKNYKY